MIDVTPRTLRLFGWVLAALWLAPSGAHAGGTRIWELTGFEELDKGEIENTTVSSLGEVTVGLRPKRLDLPEVGLVWSAAVAKDGTVFLGTGYDGKIFRLRKGKVELLAATEQLVITSLALDDRGNLFASSLPDPVIWKIEDAATAEAKEPIKPEKWATLAEGTRHVWAIAFGEKGRTLYAGTGPEGKIFALGKKGESAVYAETDEDNILSLLPRGDALLAGTSPNALLLEVRGPGRIYSLEDFDATEVKSIAPDGADVVVAVNKFSRPPNVPSKPKTTSAASTSKKTSRAPRMGDGFLYRVRDDGRTEQLWEDKSAHLVSLAVDSEGTIYAGSASGGKIFAVARDRLRRTLADLDEREVMVLLAEDGLSFAATGDAGAAYRFGKARASEARYLSPPLDAGSGAVWGRLTWFASGGVTVQARSGNTLFPDSSWTGWSKDLENGEVPGLERGRYFQLKVSWKKDPEAIFRTAQLAYRPLNTRAVVTELNPDSPFPAPKKKKKSAKKNEPRPSKRTIAARPKGENKRELEISWKVDNPDGDTLRYRLYYKGIDQDVWRPILKEDEIYTKTRYSWDTETVPEGRYAIKLVADDSPSNSPEETLADERVSVPVIVDNHQPTVTGLSFRKGLLSGEARDSFSAISALDFSVDGGPWIPGAVEDGIFDDPVERFSFALPMELDAGPHTLAVRATDRTGNSGLAEIHVVTGAR